MVADMLKCHLRLSTNQLCFFRVYYYLFGVFFFFYLTKPLETLKCQYDENRILSIKAILKHKQVACMRRKSLFVPEIFKILKYAN